jgi:hypothetical protein
MNILFWNIKKNRIGNIISQLCKENDVDVLTIAESGYNPGELLIELNSDISAHNLMKYSLSGCEKIQIYSKYNSENFKAIEESNRYTIRELVVNNCKLLFAAIHLPDKQSFNNESQSVETYMLSNTIKKVEEEYNNEK